MINHPRVLSLALFALMAMLALAGVKLRARSRMAEHDSADIALVVSATLTLLGLIIGFTFSLATTRYDLRRQYEEGEANAIGTEWVRTGLMPPALAEPTRVLLREYLDARIDFYLAGYGNQVGLIDARSSALQTRLWTEVQSAAVAQPTPIMALAVSGMNDVLNSQGYTQAAWWNRIPTTAWTLLIIIACMANLLVGFATRHVDRARVLLLIVLPLLISVALFLIADIDSPRGGLIHIPPIDLVSLRQSLPRQ